MQMRVEYLAPSEKEHSCRPPSRCASASDGKEASGNKKKVSRLLSASLLNSPEDVYCRINRDPSTGAVTRQL